MASIQQAAKMKVYIMKKKMIKMMMRKVLLMLLVAMDSVDRMR